MRKVTKKTPTRLADGRELIYFDERPDAVRALADPRDLPRGVTAPELRYDVLLDEWVAVAAYRQERTHLPPADECPLCPARPGWSGEIPAADYDVVVFENRFPSFTGNAEDAPPSEPLLADLACRRPGIGRCEVVCYTSQHASSFADLPTTRVRTVVDVWADRTRELGRIPGVNQVFCFENSGEEIGVTLHHPHGQIYAYPFVTPRTRRMLDSARRHRHRTGRNLFADVLAAERRSGERVVLRARHWTAFVPAAARWPAEIHLYPNRRVPDLPALGDAERAELAEVYPDLLRRLRRHFGEAPPYVAAWHQAPVREGRDLGYLHLQLFSIRRAHGRLKYLAGSESGMGVFLTDVLPEDMARWLRAAGP